MSEEVHIRKEGRAGRITLDRPRALNALTHQMCLRIEAALDQWAEDDDVAVIVIDGAGEKAFCAGGDVTMLYEAGRAGRYAEGVQFWRDEYRLNARIFHYPKPFVSFLHGFVMGGGVGVGCHGSHRIVGESARVAMPEVAIGLVPDVGGSLMLALAPGRTGEFLALTARRMGPADAIHAGFADMFIPEARWPDLKARLAETGDPACLTAESPPEGTLAALREEIDRLFGGEGLRDIINALRADGGAFARECLETMSRHSPLAMACAVEIIHRVRAAPSIERALEMEFRYTSRVLQQGEFLEGVRAMIVEKDRNPRWSHAFGDPVDADMVRMLLPVQDGPLQLAARS